MGCGLAFISKVCRGQGEQSLVALEDRVPGRGGHRKGENVGVGTLWSQEDLYR